MKQVEVFRAAVEKALAKLFRRPADRMSFRVREGVTFPGIELFCDNRVAQIRPAKVDQNLANGLLDEFAEHMCRMVRGKTMIPFKAEVYRRQDVLRETLFTLKSLMRVFMAPGEIATWEQRWRESLSRQAEVAEINDVLALPFLVEKAVEELKARLSREVK